MFKHIKRIIDEAWNPTPTITKKKYAIYLKGKWLFDANTKADAEIMIRDAINRTPYVNMRQSKHDKTHYQQMRAAFTVRENKK